MLAEGRLVAISPYYNDAIASCAGLLAARPDSTVLTVYSGQPLSPRPANQTDCRCSLQDGRQALLARRELSAQALTLLGAQGVQMDLLDEPYLGSGDTGRLTGALAAALSTLRPRVIVVPLGLCHSAHVRVCDAALAIRALFWRVAWLAYEEASDRGRPGAVQERLAALLRRQISATPLALDEAGDTRARQRAIAACASLAEAPETAPGQIAGEASGERYWRLAWQRDVER